LSRPTPQAYPVLRVADRTRLDSAGCFTIGSSGERRSRPGTEPDPRAGATHPGSRARTGPRSGAPAGAAPVSRSTRPPGSAAAGARSPACSGTESRPLADPAPGTTATTGDAVGLG